MQPKIIVKIILLCLFYTTSVSAIHVVLINPSKLGQPFWDRTSAVAEAAANSLNIKLTILSGQGNALITHKNIKNIITNESIDYLIFLPHSAHAKHTFNFLEQNKIPFITLENNITPSEAKEIGKPGFNYQYWLGEIQFDDVQAGKLLATALFQSNNQSKNVVALSGDKSAVAKNRELGLHQATNENTNLYQVVTTSFRPKVALNKLAYILKRYPNTNTIWAASDEIALAVRKRLDDTTTNQFIIGGIGWAPEAINAILENEINASVGGHFMQAAWAVVKIYDYHHGINAFNNTDLLPYALIDKNNVKQFIFLEDNSYFKKIDFKKYSLHLHPKNQHYNFDITTIFPSTLTSAHSQ